MNPNKNMTSRMKTRTMLILSLAAMLCLACESSVGKISNSSEPIPPPWATQYKIKAGDEGKLTPADIMGPDGFAYPDWTRAGVQGGIPDLKDAKTVKIEDFGGTPDDQKNDSDAIEKAVASLGPRGGVLQFAKGRYLLTRPICIKNSHVVLRGAGMDATKIDFCYAIPADGIDFYGLKSGDSINYDSTVSIYCRPEGLKEIEVSVNDVAVADWQRSAHSGNRFSLLVPLSELEDQIAPGSVKLTACAQYKGGKTVKKTIDLELTEKSSGMKSPRAPSAAILFSGEGAVGPEIRLAANGKRGDLELELASDPLSITPGDLICINAPETERRKEETMNACNWGIQRNYLVFVKGMNGRKLQLDQPLRIDFPIVDGAWIRKSKPISGCAVANLTIESTCDLWFTSVLFKNALDCWAENVKVVKCGRHPIYTENAKFCTIRSCIFEDAWFKGGGGSAYTGWEQSYDCLMENVVTYRMRHAPLFQWSASGNVIRDSVFYDSDAQWHSGWTSENLFENCVVHSDTKGNGGYGYGMWASPPNDDAHGPNGPRNVVYNCDVRSLKAGLWLGGMNESWIVAYSRFEVGSGTGIFLKTFGFDHVIKGNIFILKDAQSPGVTLSTRDCTGVELFDNTFYGGNGKLNDGLIGPVVTTGNKILPLVPSVSRPTPSVPSIYEWELKNAKARR